MINILYEFKGCRSVQTSPFRGIIPCFWLLCMSLVRVVFTFHSNAPEFNWKRTRTQIFSGLGLLFSAHQGSDGKVHTYSNGPH